MDWQETFYVLGSIFFTLGSLAIIALAALAVAAWNEMKKAEEKMAETKEAIRTMALSVLNRRVLIAGAVAPAVVRLISRIFGRK